MTGWQYAWLTWEASIESQAWSSRWMLRLPGEEPTDFPAADDSYVAIFDDLGAKGWELVTQTVTDTFVGTAIRGMAEVGTPVRITFVFKRPLP